VESGHWRRLQCFAAAEDACGFGIGIVFPLRVVVRCKPDAACASGQIPMGADIPFILNVIFVKGR
jgi:hypothetical protein